MKTALIGLPQAGKRTLFALLTGRAVPASRKPGEALEGDARIRDPRVDALAGICKPRKTTCALNTFVLCPDIAGGDAARAWTDAARACDLLCAVAGAFGAGDAARDLENINSELLLADMELVEKRLLRLAKEARTGQTPARQKETELLNACMRALEDGRPLADLDLPAHDAAVIRSLRLLTLIPRLAVVNVAEDAIARAAAPDTVVVSCLLEREIMGIDDAEQRQAFLRDAGLEAPGLDRVNAAAYAAQGLMSFYTVGADEVRAWTIRKGATAREAGGRIHSDIERGFIRAEIVKYDDFVAAGSEQAAKEQGKIVSRGRDYVMEDGDICHFLFNV